MIEAPCPVDLQPRIERILGRALGLGEARGLRQYGAPPHAQAFARSTGLPGVPATGEQVRRYLAWLRARCTDGLLS